MLTNEGQLRISNLTLVVVLEGELQLGQVVQKLARYLLKEYGARAVKL